MCYRGCPYEDEGGRCTLDDCVFDDQGFGEDTYDVWVWIKDGKGNWIYVKKENIDNDV